jgi:hypothetical protein
MFYTYSQNNSGGGFDVTEDLGEYVIIEAESADRANERAVELGIYFDGVEAGLDCECCGDRWSTPYDEGSEKPEIYGQPAEQALRTRRTLVIHYADGSRRTFKRKK